jgi:hypothetical protein
VRRPSPALSPLVRPWAALLLALSACADPADPCAPMCAAAASAYGACLDPDGEGAEAPEWEAAGYADRQDFLDACDTWAWEQRLIADEEGAPERVDAACAQREDALRTAADPCAAFSGMEWSAPLR